MTDRKAKVTADEKAKATADRKQRQLQKSFDEGSLSSKYGRA
jgi:hypothetical protein